MRERLLLSMLVSAIVLAAPQPSAAQATDPGALRAPSAVEARMRRALLAIEGEAPASFFAHEGAAGRDALLAMLTDRSERGLFRRRAAIALRHYPEPVVRAALEARAGDLGEDAYVSRYALRALALAFGTSAFEAIASRLSDPRAYVREGAALSLSALDARRAAPLLRARLAVEPEAFVRAALR